MKPVSSRLMVVDASVARDCGQRTTPPVPHCLRILETILKVCHRAALSDELKLEWDRHGKKSRNFMRWWKSMTNRRKIVRQDLRRLEELKGRLIRVANKQLHGLLEKDAHLVAAALEGNAVLLSRDEKLRSHLEKLAHRIQGLGDVLWVNPSRDLDTALEWLESGAPDGPEHRIGYQRDTAPTRTETHKRRAKPSRRRSPSTPRR